MLGISTWANSITASRIIFFALYIEELLALRPHTAILFFIFAWGLDAIDGPVARYMGEESTLGSQLDKTIDRIVLVGSVVILLRYEYIPAFGLFLVVKDIGLIMALTARKSGRAFISSGWQGKLLSVMQGIGILWLFSGLPGGQLVVAVVGLWGGFVAVDYLRRL